MTVSTQYSPVSYVGTGVITGLNTVNPFYDDSDLIVTKTVISTGVSTLMTITTDYTVTGGSGSAGTVTPTSAPTTDHRITIEVSIPYIQDADFEESGTFPAETLETALDKITIMAQQTSELSTRAIVVPASDGGSINVELPSSVSRASKYMYFDASGNVSVASGTEITPVSSAMEPVVGASTLALARTNMAVAGLGDNNTFTGTNTFVTQAAGDNSTKAATTAFVASAVGAAATWRNRIINGDMSLDQEHEGSATTINAASNTYAIDQWYGYGQATDGVFTLQRLSSTPPAQFTHYLRATVTTADASIGATQRYFIGTPVEGTMVSDFDWGLSTAQPATLSFYVRSSRTGTFSGVVTEYAAASQNYTFNYTISSANTWERKTVTIAGPTSGTWNLGTSSGSLYVLLDLGSGSSLRTGTPNTWQGTQYMGTTGAVSLIDTLNATLDITGAQLELGSVATSFEYTATCKNLSLCQRSYFKTYDSGVAVGTASSAGQVIWSNQSGQANPATIYSKVTMRAAPTVTSYSPSTGTSGKIYNGSADIAATVGNSSMNSAVILPTSTTILTNLTVHITMNSRL